MASHSHGVPQQQPEIFRKRRHGKNKKRCFEPAKGRRRIYLRWEARRGRRESKRAEAKSIREVERRDEGRSVRAERRERRRRKQMGEKGNGEEWR